MSILFILLVVKCNLSDDLFSLKYLKIFKTNQPKKRQIILNKIFQNKSRIFELKALEKKSEFLFLLYVVALSLIINSNFKIKKLITIKKRFMFVVVWKIFEHKIPVPQFKTCKLLYLCRFKHNIIRL